MITKEMEGILRKISDLCYKASEEIYEDECIKDAGILNLCSELYEKIDKYLEIE